MSSLPFYDFMNVGDSSSSPSPSSLPFYDFMNVGGSSSSSGGGLEFKKQLSGTDTSFYGSCYIMKDAMTQLVLPYWDAARRQAYENDENVDVCVRDCDTQSEHHLKVKKDKRFCRLTGGWNQQFLNGRNLKEGDQISLCWNVSHQRFDFRLVQRAA